MDGEPENRTPIAPREWAAPAAIGESLNAKNFLTRTLDMDSLDHLGGAWGVPLVMLRCTWGGLRGEAERFSSLLKARAGNPTRRGHERPRGRYRGSEDISLRLDPPGLNRAVAMEEDA